MWRKTRRISKKRRRHTKKRRNVKRTHKYKYLRGGLGVNDYENIGISTKFSFGNPDKLDYEKIQEFKKYVFGSEEHAQKWEEILSICAGKEKNIPFYILTSGNKVGIIRTLQLLELADYVTEVLCNSENVLANPRVVNSTFNRMNKYQIIRSILEARCDQPDYTGIFIDNDERQMNNNELCNNVGFIHATGDNINIYDVSLYPRTIFMTYVLGLSSHHSLSHYFDEEVIKRIYIKNTNLVHTTVLDDIIRQLNSNRIQILFADFDGTMSPWGGALPFHLPAFKQFFNTQFKVVTSDL